MIEISRQNPDDEDKDDEAGNQKDTFSNLTNKYEDDATTELFQSRFPMKELPPEFAATLKGSILDEVNRTLKPTGESTEAEIKAEFYDIMTRPETPASPDQPNQESGDSSAESQNTFTQRIRNVLKRVMGLFNKS